MVRNPPVAGDKPTDPQPMGKGKDGRSLTSNVYPTPFNTSTATPTPIPPQAAPLLLAYLSTTLKILLSPFIEINGFTFLNVTCFSLQINDNYKTSNTANSSHNFLFFGYYELSKQIFKFLFLLPSTITRTLSTIRAKSYIPN